MQNDESNLLKIKNKTQKHIKHIIAIFIITLIVILSIFLLWNGERLLFFILSRPSYYSLHLSSLSIGLDIKNTICFWTTLIIQLYLHIIFLRYCVLSIIFLLGGFFKRFFIYSHFNAWITYIITLLKGLQNIKENALISSYKTSFKNLKAFQKIYNRMTLAKQSFELKGKEFGHLLNDITYLYQQAKTNKAFNIKQIEQLNVNIQALIDVFLTYNNFHFIEILFKFKYENVLTHLHNEVLNDFKTRKATTIQIANDFPAVLISPEINDSNVTTLVVFCNQNAVCTELYHLSKENFNYYLTISNASILLWNYKGYGLRKGTTNFGSIDYDVQSISHYIKNEFPLNTKVIIHGISIGGYAAIKLAQTMNDPKNVLLIADRTFGDINLITKTMPYGRILSVLYTILFPFYASNSSNIKPYISIRNKILFYDEKDCIIPSFSNLITNVSYVYFNDILRKPIELLLNKSFSSKYDISSLILSPREINELKKDIESLSDNPKLSNLFNGTFLKNMKRLPLNKFIIDFLIFGFPFNVFKEIPYDNEDMLQNYSLIPVYLQEIFNDNKKELSEIFIKFLSNLNVLYVNILMTNEVIEKDLREFSYNKKASFILKESIRQNIIDYFGYTKRIFCGHNGRLNNNEEDYIHDYLEREGFIPVAANTQIN